MIDLATRIDEEGELLACGVRHGLQSLDGFSTEALDGLFCEYFHWLSDGQRLLREGAGRLKDLAGGQVEGTLWRCAQRLACHLLICQTAMRELGLDSGQREAFKPTAQVCESVGRLVAARPGVALGALYATQSATLFGHQAFRRIASELYRRRVDRAPGRHGLRLNLHLDGIDHAHKAELSACFAEAFVDEAGQGQVWVGAVSALESLRVWWRALLSPLAQPSAPGLAAAHGEP